MSVIYGQGGTNIGNGVRIAAHCVIVPSNHIFDDPDEYIYKQGLSKKGIIIEDDVWLGAGVKVLDGVVIKKGCVFGANSVVTKSTEKNGIYVGIPAKLIKYRCKVDKI
ncbi:acyltransferase [Macellibacteroides fermentans]|uniref:acyltransferase n=1 Tax=Macellibacteroides fermentans TaxID=879969 RepID=UPI00406CE24F